MTYILMPDMMNMLRAFQQSLCVQSKVGSDVNQAFTGCRSTCSGTCDGSCAGGCEGSCSGSCNDDCSGDYE